METIPITLVKSNAITCQHCGKDISGCHKWERVTRTCGECYQNPEIAAQSEAEWKDYIDEMNGGYR